MNAQKAHVWPHRTPAPHTHPGAAPARARRHAPREQEVLSAFSSAPASSVTVRLHVIFAYFSRAAPAPGGGAPGRAVGRRRASGSGPIEQARGSSSRVDPPSTRRARGGTGCAAHPEAEAGSNTRKKPFFTHVKLEPRPTLPAGSAVSLACNRTRDSPSRITRPRGDACEMCATHTPGDAGPAGRGPAHRRAPSRTRGSGRRPFSPRWSRVWLRRPRKGQHNPRGYASSPPAAPVSISIASPCVASAPPPAAAAARGAAAPGKAAFQSLSSIARLYYARMEVEARAHAAEQACAAAIRQQREEEAWRAEAERVRTAAAAEAESLRQGFVHAQHELRRTCMALAGGMLGSLSLVLGTRASHRVNRAGRTRDGPHPDAGGGARVMSLYGILWCGRQGRPCAFSGSVHTL